MDWYKFHNQKTVSIESIPILSIDTCQRDIIELKAKHYRPVHIFGLEQDAQIRVFYILANDESSSISIASVVMKRGDRYPSITLDYPSFHIFERELWEEFNLIPEGHPWLKPVRFPYNNATEYQNIEQYPFLACTSDQTHEVAVGPIHAGVIEPGHFRFLCNGEKVLHLEIQLGYQHRGVESLFLQNDSSFYRTQLIESIAGDTVIGHMSAYTQLLEGLSNQNITSRAKIIRAIALEMERIAIHIGDLSAIATDIAYTPASSYLGGVRTLVINSMLRICGNRFGRGLLRENGVRFDISDEQVEYLAVIMNRVLEKTNSIAEVFFSQPSVLSRLEHTGQVSQELALQIGLLGPSARASGIARDVRADHPFGNYVNAPIYPLTMDRGDVFARSYMRYIEIQQSVHYIQEQLKRLTPMEIMLKENNDYAVNSLCLSLVEGWRGEIAHIAITDDRGKIIKYKIKDPSLCNWYGLALSVRNNGISDFPICNKSFNLSYCGHDL